MIPREILSLKDGLLCIRQRVVESVTKPLGDVVGTLTRQTIRNKTFDKSNIFDIQNLTAVNITVTNLTTGSLKTAYSSVSSTYTALTTDHTIEAIGGTFTISLYTAVGNSGKQLIIKNSGSGVITVDGFGSQTIDGDLTKELLQYDSLMIQSNGGNWIIL